MGGIAMVIRVVGQLLFLRAYEQREEQAPQHPQGRPR